MFGPLIANATRWFDRRRGIAVAVVACGQSVAGAVWPPVLRYVTETAGWRQAVVWYGAFALCTLVPLSLLLRPMPPAQRDPAPAAGGPRDGAAAAAAGTAVGLPAGLVQAMLCLAIVGCCVAMAMPMVHVIAHATDLGYPTTRAAE